MSINNLVKQVLIKGRDLVWIPMWSILWLPFITVGYLLIAPVGKIITEWRCRLGKKPRIVWAAYALPQTAYMVQADREAGYDSQMLIWYPSYYNRRVEITALWRKIAWWGRWLILPRYIMFLWSLVRFDILQYYFDQRQLSNTLLDVFELKLLKLAGKSIIVSPYGGDVFIRGMMAWNGEDLIDVLARDYPRIYELEKVAKRNLRIANTYADLILSIPPHADVMPRYEEFRHSLCIDLSEWAVSGSKRHDGKVLIAHSSNHRHIKGTQYVIEVVDQLRKEGYSVELDLIEGISRENTRRRYAEADIVVEQLIIGIYGMTAVESMALGKPVITYLRDDVITLMAGKGLPVISASPDTLYLSICKLLADPSLRQRLGEMGREFVKQHHSVQAFSAMHDRTYRKLWSRMDSAIATEIS